MDHLDPAELEDYLQLILSVLSLVIFAVAVMAYRRRPTTRMLLMTTAFGLYVLRSLFLIGDFVFAEDVVDFLESAAIFLEAGFVALIMLSFLKN